jgi:hypothetical protein
VRPFEDGCARYRQDGEFGDAVRGSNALTAGVDVVLELERPSRGLQLSSHARVLRAVSRFSTTPEELFLELDDRGFSPIENLSRCELTASASVC